MKIIEPYTTIYKDFDGQTVLRKLEVIGRTCYQSRDKIEADSSEEFVRKIIERGHESILEHQSVTVTFVCDRGISHELVRHRIASFAQESTRFCSYSGLVFIKPLHFRYRADDFASWADAMELAETHYLSMIDEGHTPEEARGLLPNSLKTEVVMTANLREWRHFFKLRAAGTTGKPHPQMLQLTVPLFYAMKLLIPVVFDDIDVSKYDKYKDKSEVVA